MVEHIVCDRKSNIIFILFIAGGSRTKEETGSRVFELGFVEPVQGLVTTPDDLAAVWNLISVGLGCKETRFLSLLRDMRSSCTAGCTAGRTSRAQAESKQKWPLSLAARPAMWEGPLTQLSIHRDGVLETWRQSEARTKQRISTCSGWTHKDCLHLRCPVVAFSFVRRGRWTSPCGAVPSVAPFRSATSSRGAPRNGMSTPVDRSS